MYCVCEKESCAFLVICRKFKPHLLMVLVQIALTFLYFLVEASFNNGMNPHVFTTYRHALGGIVLLPFAYVLERNVRPKLTLAIFLKLFLISLVGVSLTLNMFFASLKYTSPSFITSMINTVSSITFIIAVSLRLEVVEVKNPRGVAKILGTLLSLGGALTMTLYKGHAIPSLQGAPIHITRNSVHNHWFKGSILTVSSCVLWSLWFITQAIVVKKYPAQLSLTVWVNVLGAAQSAVFTAVMVRHKPKTWLITSSVEICCIFYGGVICCGLVLFIQLWTVKEKGPVFVSMFNPLGTILVATFAYFLLGEQLHVGSVVGGVIVIIGLYLLLWGKDRDGEYKSGGESFPTHNEEKESTTEKTVVVTSPQDDRPT